MAISAQERAHLKRTRGMMLAIDKFDHDHPVVRTAEGEALDKQRGLVVKMPGEKQEKDEEVKKNVAISLSK